MAKSVSKVAGLVSALRSAIAADEKSKVAKRMVAKPKAKKKFGGKVGSGVVPVASKKTKPVAKAKSV